MAIGTTAAIIGASLIGGAANMISSSSAAKAQTEASREATNAQLQAIEKSRQAQLSGVNNAINHLNAYDQRALTAMKSGTAQQVQPLWNATVSANQTIQNNAQQQAGRERTSFQNQRDALNRGYQQAGSTLLDNLNAQLGINSDTYDTQSEILNPYIERGQAASDAYAYNLGIGDKPEGYSGFRGDPGYEFRRSEALRDLESSAAAGGNLRSGATLRALQDRSYGLADQSFNTHMGQLGALGTAGQGASGQLAGYAGTRGAADAAAQGNYATNTANLQTSRGANIAGLIDNRDNAISGYQTNAANQLAQNRLNLGGNMSNIYGEAAANRANMLTNMGANRASLWGNYGKDSANLALKGGAVQAEGLYNIGNARAANSIAMGNAFNDMTGNILSGYLYGQGLA